MSLDPTHFIQIGAVIRGAGRIVSEERWNCSPTRRFQCENGWVFWADPQVDYIDGNGWLILESAVVDDRGDEPAVVPWAARERWVA